MIKNPLLHVALVCALSLISSTSVNAQEGKIRQASNNRVVYGQLNGPVKFTVAGKLSDMVTVELRGGTRFAKMTIKQLKNSPFSGGSYVGSGGDTVVRVRISRAQSRFNGGKVLIHRGHRLIDADRVTLH